MSKVLSIITKNLFGNRGQMQSNIREDSQHGDSGRKSVKPDAGAQPAGNPELRGCMCIGGYRGTVIFTRHQDEFLGFVTLKG